MALGIGACSEEGGASPGIDAGTHDAAGDAAAQDASADAATHDAGGDASPDADPDPCALGCPADTHDVDANPLTGVCGCEYACPYQSAVDPFDAAFADENCDGGDGVVEACVYVSASLGRDDLPGTRHAPMQTITAALQQAEAEQLASVCLSGEAYVEVFTVPSGIELVGSFDHLDPDFAFRRKAGVVTTVGGVPLP